MGKRKASSSDDKSSSNQKNNQHKVRKGKNTVDDNKIHYVLAPKKIAEKREQIKNTEKEEKQKSHLKQKQKRNSAFLKKTKKGQPDLGSRMKVLYSQIQKNFGGGATK